MTALPAYEVFALRYATVARSKNSNFIIRDEHDGSMPLDFFVWLARAEDRTFVVDTGFGDYSATTRGRTLEVCPAEGLRALGLDPATVPDVILTHLHYDHAGNLDKFPTATFHIQDSEVAYATGRCMTHGVFRHAYEVEDIVTLVRKVYAGRVRFHDGDVELAPGLSLHRIGGHTDGLQVVRVHTARGWIVLASDASHYYANIEDANPFPIVADVRAMVEGYRRLETLADSPEHIVPGHDPEVLRIYPRADVGGIAVAALHLRPHARPARGWAE